MLKNTFSIFPGIGARIERHLWRMGVFTWQDFLARDRIPGFSDTRKAVLDALISAALGACDAGDLGYFRGLLGPSETWRLWSALADDALCLDIETDGRSAAAGYVTVAGFYSHGEYRSYVQGKDLNLGVLQYELGQARLLVTYFGGGFDLPYLKACYPGLDLDIPHFDLCPAGHKAGLKGGLKKVERMVGIQRAEDVEGLSGFDAVMLWQAYKNGSEEALGMLIGYNREDTVNLHALAWIIYEKLREATGLPAIMAERLSPGAPHVKP